MAGARGQAGFTLLELLVALTLFAILSAMAYGGLRMVLDSKQRNEQQAQRLIELQTALNFLQRDIEQAVGRSVRDEFGDPQPALRADGFGARLITLTRAGWRNPTGQPRSTLQRVAYRFDEGRLTRLFWHSLDQSGNAEPLARVLLQEVAEIELRFLDQNRQWHGQWPPAAGEAPLTLLPRAVEVTLRLDDLGAIRRLLRVAPGEASVPQTFVDAP